MEKPKAKPSKRQVLWKRQRGKCAHCGKPLPVKGSHRHHTVKNSSSVNDLQLLHPRCHNKHVHGKRA